MEFISDIQIQSIFMSADELKMGKQSILKAASAALSDTDKESLQTALGALIESEKNVALNGVAGAGNISKISRWDVGGYAALARFTIGGGRTETDSYGWSRYLSFKRGCVLAPEDLMVALGGAIDRCERTADTAAMVNLLKLIKEAVMLREAGLVFSDADNIKKQITTNPDWLNWLFSSMQEISKVRIFSRNVVKDGNNNLIFLCESLKQYHLDILVGVIATNKTQEEIIGMEFAEKIEIVAKRSMKIFKLKRDPTVEVQQPDFFDKETKLRMVVALHYLAELTNESKLSSWKQEICDWADAYTQKYFTWATDRAYNMDRKIRGDMSHLIHKRTDDTLEFVDVP